MAEKPFLIAGGGIAGLAASLGLARIGQPSRVFEQAAEFSEVGAGLQMSPNAVRAIRWLGAWDAVEPHCVIPTEIHVRDGYSDRLLRRIRLGKAFEQRFAAPYRVLHRADLLGGLLATARTRDEVELCLSSPVLAAESTADGAGVTLAGGRAEGVAVIGADGIRSQLRRQIAGAADPVYREQTIFRALIPLSEVPPGIAADCVTLWLYPGGHVVHYAVSNWRQFNIVATIDSPWQSSGWSEPGTPDELREGFKDAAPALADLLAVPKTWLKWAGADCEPLDTWTQGRIALMGDAAHASLPFLAQGAAMALEDACVLAGELDGEPPVQAALARYAGRRRPRTARVQLASRQLAGVYHAKGLRRSCRNLAMTMMPSETFLASLRWIYDFDVMRKSDRTDVCWGQQEVTMRKIISLAFVAVLGISMSGPAWTMGDKAKATAPTAKDCKTGQVWDKKNKKCIKAESGVLPDEELYDQGRALAKEGQYDWALTVLAAISNQNDPKVLNYIGYSHRKSGRIDEGIAHYQKALAIDPDFVLAREYLGEGYVASGQIELAKLELSEIEKRCGTACEEYQDLAEAIAAAK